MMGLRAHGKDSYPIRASLACVSQEIRRHFPALGADVLARAQDTTLQP
jgi:hypothetical protein